MWVWQWVWREIRKFRCCGVGGCACWALLIRRVRKLRCESIMSSNERGGVCVLFMRRRGGEEGGRKDGDHHKQLLVTVEVSSLLFLNLTVQLLASL